MTKHSPHAPGRPPHPLALALIERLRERTGAPVLEIGVGSGRNTAALEAAGFPVVSLEESGAPPCAGALSTHALLHGTPSSIAQMLAAIAGALEPGAPFYATFGSVRDARCGEGEEREPHVFAPVEGDEAGVPHLFFDRERLVRAIEPRFFIESLDEVDVDAIAGGWAHERAPLHGAVHWFAKLRKR